MVWNPAAFNSTVNMSPLLRAIQGFQQGHDQAADFRTQQSVGGRISAGDWTGAQSEAAKGGMDIPILVQLGQKAREDQMRQEQAKALQNPDVIGGLSPQYRAALQALSPEQRAQALADVHNPLTREKLDIQREQMRRAQMDQFGKAGTIVQGPDGQFYSVQFGSNGKKIVEPLMAGGKPLTPARGTDVVGDTIINKATGQEVRNVAPNLANAERVKGIGDAQGKAQGAATSDMAAADDALRILDSIRKDPNKERGTGPTAVFNKVPFTKGYDFQTKVDQAKSGAFLTAIQQMRGMGALSNAEGQTATQAVTRMTTATTREGFEQALNDYEEIVRRGQANARARASAAQQMSPQAVPQTPQAAPQQRMPKPGEVMQGHRFKGGNPADPNDWERVQ